MSYSKNKVGCWFSNKKKKKLNVDHLCKLFREYDLQVVEINLDEDIASQGPFVAIVHKLTDLMIEAKDGSQKAEDNLSDLKLYLASHTNTVMVDPFHSLEVLLNRFETYRLIQHTKVCVEDKVLHVPTFTQITCRDKEIILEQMKADNVKFPFVCKKNLAHGSESHKMSIIFNEEGLCDVDPPCVAQTFIDHGALLYKIYVIADKYHMVKRPSLRNFTKTCWKDHGTIFFNSHNISSGDCLRSKLTTLDSSDVNPESVDETIVRRLVKQLGAEIEMTMYGIDIIVCPRTGNHYAIDVNVFPGYDGVDDYLEILVDSMMQRIRHRDEPLHRATVRQELNGTKCAAATTNGCDKLTNGVHSV